MFKPPLQSALFVSLIVVLGVDTVGCGKDVSVGARITDSSKIVIEPGRGVPKVCEIGMSFAEIKRATGEASIHKLKWRDPSRFVLVPSLGVIGIHEQKDGVRLLTFYIQPYDSSITSPGLAITNPFRGSLSTNLSFSNGTVSRKEVEAAFGLVMQGITNGADFSKLPDKTKPFSVKGETLHYPCLGLSFDLKNDTVESVTVRKPQKFE